jgi:hypothetical protein
MLEISYARVATTKTKNKKCKSQTLCKYGYPTLKSGAGGGGALEASEKYVAIFLSPTVRVSPGLLKI